jgi:hypothetical protein
MWQLYKASLMASFGRGSLRPKEAMITRLTLLISCSLILGLVSVHALGTLPALGNGRWQAASLAIFVVELVCIASLLGTRGMLYGERDSLWALLILWPLKQRQKQITLLLPSLILVVSTLCLCLPLLHELLQAMRLGMCWELAGIICGISASLGLSFGLMGCPYWLQTTLTVITLWTQYQLLTRIQQSSSTSLFILFVALTLLVGSLLFFRPPFSTHTTNSNDIVYTNLALPYFVKKIARSRSAQINTLTYFVASLGCLYAFGRLYFGSQLSVAISSFIVSAVTSDFRSFAARNSPPEIVQLRGSWHFLASQFQALPLALIPVAPLLISAFSNASGLLCLIFICQLLAAGCIGLFAGTLLVPDAHDLCSQCVASLLCFGLLATPAFTSISSWSAWAQASFYAGVSLGLIFVTFHIEHQRNPYNWRKYATNHNT